MWVKNSELIMTISDPCDILAQIIKQGLVDLADFAVELECGQTQTDTNSADRPTHDFST